MYVNLQEVSVTASTSGAATVYTDDPVTGAVYQIRYSTADGALGSTGTVAITGEKSGVAVYSRAIGASFTAMPRCNLVNSTNGTVIYSTANAKDRPAEPFVVANERLKFTCAKMTASATGKFRVWIT